MGGSFKIDVFGVKFILFLFFASGLALLIGFSSDDIVKKVITILIGVVIIIFAVYVIIDYQKRDN